MPRRAVTKEAERDSSERGGRDSGVQVLARAGEILRLLNANPSGLNQAEISTKLTLARSTVHRILSALAAEGLVAQSLSSSRYHLGREILLMAEGARSALVSEVHPLLQDLSAELDETVDLSVLESGQVTFVDQVVGGQRLRAVSVIGASFPLYCTANGKAILAAMNNREVDRACLGGMIAYTPNTITDMDNLRSDLEGVRQRGFACDLEEHSTGICAVGVALLGSPFKYAALSVPIPVQRFNEKKDIAAAAIRRSIQPIETIWREAVASR